MVTGVEAAGLTLAVFPLLTQGLKVYLEGVQSFWGLRNWKRVLSEIIRELDVECICFENVCGKLLEGMISTGDAKDPMNGDTWDDPELQRKLQERLGPQATERFTELAKELLQLLENLKEELGIQDESRQLNSQTWGRMKAVLRKEGVLREISTTVRLLERLAQFRIHSFTKSPRPNTQIYNRSRKDANALYNTLLGSFSTQRRCHCSSPHNASLRLERIPKPNTPSWRFSVLLSFDICSDKQPKPLWAWREVEFQPLGDYDGPGVAHQAAEIQLTAPSIPTATLPLPVESRLRVFSRLRSALRSKSGAATRIPGIMMKEAASSEQITSAVQNGKNKAMAATTQGGQARKGVSFAVGSSHKVSPIPPDARKITDLCADIASAGVNAADLSVLVSATNWLIRMNTSSCEKYTSDLVSLDHLLKGENLIRGARLRLAMELAFSLMHLHGTKWLDEDWGKCDILFPQKVTRARGASGEEVMILGADLRKPVVRRSFRLDSHSQHRSVPPAKRTIVAHDKNLFSLGIVLIELWFGKRLQDLTKPEDAVPNDADTAVWVTASRLLQDIEVEAGQIFSDAVKCCVFGLGGVVKTLENDDFKSKVITEVVLQLERHCKAYDGDV